MKWSQAHIFTLREAPADAEIISHQLLVRGGYIRKLAPGVHTYQNLALRVVRKVEKIIREELDAVGCTEVLMPMVQPKELWDESGRWEKYGDLLLKMQNRNAQWFCLGPTHEEVITDLVRKDVRSYRDLPRNLYQIQTKYRDEIRPRFGLMRGREFIMKDAYSFDKTSADALKAYDVMYAAYKRIFDRMGLKYRIVDADAGNIGGSQTHEFQVLAESGEDHLMACDTCEFAANIEIAPVVANEKPSTEALKSVEKFPTPGLKTIADLAKSTGLSDSDLVKTMFYKTEDNRVVTVILRGSDEVNPIKLKNTLGLTNPPELLLEDEVLQFTGAHPGSCGPHGLVSKKLKFGKFDYTASDEIYVDHALKGRRNFIVGANQDDQHFRNVNFDRDFKAKGYFDLRLAKAGDLCGKCGKGHYQSYRGIEVGHVFYLGTKYSKSLQATYLDVGGKSQVIEMGCYGIGVSRTVQAAIEQCHDADGIAWPAQLAPYDAHICVLDAADPSCAKVADELVKKLEGAGLEVLIDDRDERPGVKFKDADLIGMPLRIVIGKKGVEKNEIELVVRKTKEKLAKSPADAASFAIEWINSQK